MVRKIKRIFRRIMRYIPGFTVFTLLFAIFSLAVILIADKNSAFADSFNGTFSAALRAVMATLTSWIPFSLAEFMLITSPILIGIVVAAVVKKAGRGRRYMFRSLVGVLSLGVFVFSFFSLSFGVGYRTTRLDKRIGLDKTKVSAEELYNTVLILVDGVNRASEEVLYVGGVGSLRPYSHKEAVRLCTESYEKLIEEYGFINKVKAPVKEIMLSEPMTYSHISGMYTFFTGEANLNTNYPHYVKLYTIAHEMAHQRGIAREDEANFMAYLVCIGSDDAYMQYAGYINMLEYFLSPLYSASKELYRDAVGRLGDVVLYDMQCYSDFFDKYRENVVAEVSSAVNNTYLVSQGTEGEKSYGMVVDLTVAYYRPEFNR